MAPDSAALKLLLISPWVIKITELQASLRDHGLHAEIVRVDFAAALRAALCHHRFDFGVYVPTPGLPLDAVWSQVRPDAPRLVMIEATDLARAGHEVARAARARWS